MQNLNQSIDWVKTQKCIYECEIWLNTHNNKYLIFLIYCVNLKIKKPRYIYIVQV